MNPRAVHKLIFTGPMGAGKTTAIAAISDQAPFQTEALNLDRAQSAKDTTTVAFDYGEVAMEGGSVLRLYGSPGQQRFDFVWQSLTDGALGIVLLLDNQRPQPLADLDYFLKQFDAYARRAAMVIGVGRSDDGAYSTADYADRLQQHSLCLPVFAVDVRRRDDVLLLLDALLAQIEARETLSS